MKKLLILLYYIFFSFKIIAAEVPFAFTVDEKVQDIKNYELSTNTKSTELNNDKYWNQPLTKLDYVLIQLKNSADKTSDFFLTKINPNGTRLDFYFEKAENPIDGPSFLGKYKTPRASNSVYFDELKGKIIVKFEISDVGKAKKPMKEICSDIMKYYIAEGFNMPRQELFGFSHHNTLLKELYRGGNFDDYNKYLETIANNLVYVLILNSTVSKSLTLKKMEEDHFVMICSKISKNEKIRFGKSSFTFKSGDR